MSIFPRFSLISALSEMSDASVDRSSSEVVPPKFTQLLKDLEGTEGQKVRFECRVIGHPTPEIRWFRDGNEIVSSPDFQVRGNILAYKPNSHISLTRV